MLVEEAVVKILKETKTEFVFGFPGETTLPLYDAINNSTIKHIIARDERCAAHMADGYARTTNKTGICDAPAGMGTPFLCPALLEAYNSSIPILAIVSSTPLKKRGKWPTSELNQVKLLEAVTKKQFLISNENQVLNKTTAAIKATKENRSRPVLLEITYNLFRKNVSIKKNLNEKIPSNSNLNNKICKKALSLLIKAEKPVIFAGGGIFLSNAIKELIKFAEYFNIPVTTTLTGKGAIPEIHPLNLGVSGSKGRTYVNEYISNCDLAIVLGSKLGEKATNNWTLFNKKQKIVRVDIDKKELLNNDKPVVAILGDIKTVLKKLLDLSNRLRINKKRGNIHNLKNKWLKDFEKSCKYSGNKIKPQLILKELKKITPKNNIIIADGSVSSGWTGVQWNTTEIGRKFIACRGTGMIGFALPAAIGAKIGSPKDKIISFTGDGGFMFSAEELETAHRYEIPFTQIILNNNSLGLLQQHQKYVFKRKTLTDFSDTDFCKMAEAMKVKSLKIEKKTELKEGLKYALKLEEPIVLDIIIDKNELAPDFKNTLIRKNIDF